MNWINRILVWRINNKGYITQPQRRFKQGEVTTISRAIRKNSNFKSGMMVTILGTAVKDYIIEDANGNQEVVLQYELDWDNRSIMKEMKYSRKYGEIIDF